jgi:putative methyltransferase (TIGR04325 family)
VRRLLKSFAPPIVTDYRWGGRSFPTWKEAQSKASSYLDQQFCAFRIARAKLRTPDGTLLATNLLYLAARSLGIDSLSVTDFGGSTGELGVDFLNAFPIASYTVAEVPTLVSMMNSGSGVKFSTEIPAQCDIFFSSGALQYLDDPRAILAAGFASARHAVVLARNSFCESEIFRVQKSRLFNNGSGPVPAGFDNVTMSYPHRTIQESAVQKIAREHGFRCIARIEESDGVLPYRGMVYGRQLVFVR